MQFVTENLPGKSLAELALSYYNIIIHLNARVTEREPRKADDLLIKFMHL